MNLTFTFSHSGNKKSKGWTVTIKYLLSLPNPAKWGDSLLALDTPARAIQIWTRNLHLQFCFLICYISTLKVGSQDLKPLQMLSWGYRSHTAMRSQRNIRNKEGLSSVCTVLRPVNYHLQTCNSHYTPSTTDVKLQCSWKVFLYKPIIIYDLMWLFGLLLCLIVNFP